MNNFNKAIFDQVIVIKNYSEIDGIQYPKDPIMVNDDDNYSLDQYRDMKLFYIEDVCQSLLYPIITYDKKKTYYPIQIFDLRFQVDHTSPKKIRPFEDFDETPVNTCVYIILMKFREIKLISDGTKIISVEVV